MTSHTFVYDGDCAVSVDDTWGNIIARSLGRKGSSHSETRLFIPHANQVHKIAKLLVIGLCIYVDSMSLPNSL